MRSQFSPLFASLFVALAGLALGCQVSSGPRGTRDSGPAGADAPISPGTDAPIVTADGPAWDRGVIPGVDSDSDGLSDADEIARGTDPHNPDTDGDGYDDGVEVVAGTNPTDSGSFIPPTDFYVVLPYGDPALHRNLDFTARLGRADVFFLVDTTGSMGVPIRNVRTSLSTTIVPAIEASIADAVMGVGDYQDFPVAPYGAATDYNFALRQSMTTDVAAVQAALDGLRLGNGSDGPESGTEALFRTVADPCTDPEGGIGAACFRFDSHPIIVMVTDAPFHNGPDPSHDYGVGDADMNGITDPPIPGAHTWTETLTALNGSNVRVVGAAVGAIRLLGIVTPSGATPDLEALAAGTGSRNVAGDPTVYQVFMGNVTTAVVDGIVDLVGAARQDVTSATRDDPSDATDATGFIQAITPVSSSRPTTHDLTTFYDVPGGTTVTFDVAFMNDFVPATTEVQIFRAYIDVVDLASTTTLDTRNVYIVVPPDGGILF